MKNNIRIALYVIAFVLGAQLWNRWQIVNTPVNTPINTIQENQVPGLQQDVPGANTGTASASSSNNQQDLIEVKTDVFHLWINKVGGDIVRAKLLTYPVSKDNPNPLELMKSENPGRFSLQSGLIGDNSPSAEALYNAEKALYILEGDELKIPLTWENNGLKISKIYTFKKGKFSFDLQQKIDNQSTQTWKGFSYERFLFGQARPSGSLGQVATFTGGVFSSPEDRYQKIDLDEMKKRVQTEAVNSGWVALIQHYFIGAIIPEANSTRIYFTNAKDNDHFVGSSRETVQVDSGKNYTFNSQIYLGPKIQKDLRELAPDLDKTVDYGIFFMIGKLMFKVLNAIHGALGNWGWSIVIMTLLIKGLFFVPSAWAYKSMAKMRKLAPEMQRLKERYGDDRQAMSTAIMALYRKEKVNPASGCLPMLLQIPFFLAFYWVLVESVELRLAPWLGWVKDLSSMDPYFILPLINAALMYLQQKLNPPPTDPMQAKVMQMLPIIFGVMFMWFPSGLVLYWTVSNAFSIVQQYVMNKKYGGTQEPLKAVNE